MSRVLPILFNTDMVRAILDGRKTVTRRVCKDGNDFTVPDMSFYDAGKRTYAVHNYADKEHTDKLSLVERTCPICPGDILYIRETFKRNRDGYSGIDFEGYIYRADCKTVFKDPYNPWTPSIHMPKEVARIWLKVTDVRVERLHDMTPDDCSEEGIRFYDCPAGFTWKSNTDMKNCYIEAVGAMKALWNSTVKKTDLYLYGWDTNPWVWVIEFERCEKPDIGGNYVAV